MNGFVRGSLEAPVFVCLLQSIKTDLGFARAGLVTA